MDSRSAKFFALRDRSRDLHKEALRSSAKPISLDISITINHVFDQLPAVFRDALPAPFPEQAAMLKKPHVPTKDWVAWRFYTEGFYCAPSLHKGYRGQTVDPHVF